MRDPMPSVPADPDISRNSFRARGYHGQAIPGLADAKSHLPIPVLPDQPEWVEMYWRAWELIWTRLSRPKKASGLITNYISPPEGDALCVWDTAFQVLSGLYGRRAFNAVGALDNFYALQQDDGFISRELRLSGDRTPTIPYAPSSSGPNILAWAEWRYFRQTDDTSRIPQVFWPLLSFHRWQRANRTWRNGLYWSTGLSSAMVNQGRVPGGTYHHCHWIWVDACMQAALETLILSQMAELLGHKDLTEGLVNEHLHLVRAINDRLWNESTGYYHDLGPERQFGAVKSIGAYWGLLAKDLIPRARLDPFLRHLRDEQAFCRPHRVPSQSADSEGYNGETGDYWRGGVWSPANYMLLKGLRQVGQDRLAHAIAVNHLENIGRIFEKTDTFWEYYSPETASPGRSARAGFAGWAGVSAIAILFEDVIGLQVDWPLRRVVWDRRLNTDRAYGVENYPLGMENRFDLIADDEAVSINPSCPLNLVIRTGEKELQMAVPAGKSEILC